MPCWKLIYDLGENYLRIHLNIVLISKELHDITSFRPNLVRLIRVVGFEFKVSENEFAKVFSNSFELWNANMIKAMLWFMVYLSHNSHESNQLLNLMQDFLKPLWNSRLFKFIQEFKTIQCLFKNLKLFKLFKNLRFTTKRLFYLNIFHNSRSLQI